MKKYEYSDEYYADLAAEHAYMRQSGMAYDPEAGVWVCRRHRPETITRTDGSVVTVCQNGCGKVE